jgi:NAD-dependent SIR2 family protein deacetylase
MSLQAAAELLRGRRVVVLAGAGLSTESGIPDYRSPGRPVRTPIQHRDFLRSEATRRRYWARSFVGWPRIAAARPNRGHLALAALEAASVVCGVITQNVDGLHQQAGHRRVVELHGSMHAVRCLDCGASEPREALQTRIDAANPGWQGGGVALPDGDAEVSADALAAFVMPTCMVCAGVLKPDVVFFGDNVRPPILEAAWRLFDEGERLLVVGSSLTVFSGFRFVRRAAERATPVAICTLGPTRGDGLSSVKVEAPLGEVLPALAAALTA